MSCDHKTVLVVTIYFLRRLGREEGGGERRWASEEGEVEGRVAVRRKGRCGRREKQGGRTGVGGDGERG